jgi:AraC-like DNA-binding protein
MRGRGRVVAAKFKPGGLCAFVREPMHRFTGQVVPAARVLGRSVDAMARGLVRLDDQAAAFALCDALRALSPRVDADAERAGAIVRAIETDHAITRVSEVSERYDIAPLALQRLFRQKIGVSPKWIIQRYRVHEALERIHHGEAITWAALAAELGFTDQAHFARTFRQFVGTSPGRYARERSNV